MSVVSLHSQKLKSQGFSDEDIYRAERFGRPVAALYGYVGIENGVVTPKGQGTLHRVTSDGALVLLTRGKAIKQRKNGEWYAPLTVVDPEEVRPA